jgi:plastocyanin
MSPRWFAHLSVPYARPPPGGSHSVLPIRFLIRLRGCAVLVGMKVIALVLTLLALALAGCGAGGDGSSSEATPATSSGSGATPRAGTGAVTIQDYEYGPASLTVPVGTTVKFTNRDSTPHTATSKESGVFESGPIDTGKTGTIELEQTGTFTYYCVFHPFMKGTITVK